ncbi:MsnO8 family LLM class oxidoreductase [Peribacillus frigoritolerans]|uniref:MsnO8 family LLM class oxidoreductase n=1 Tax=Peribacillus frigoritolerans TaxID=450367 RepID=UPI0022814908|nr:MsnO8 family LLM class oxidoreductase [Peribacillus frigoritolerans]MCY9007293.1 MsnO8 family LLM class oxidoreductase [Peribacillus frigoritolerans]
MNYSILDYVHIFKGETPKQALENTKETLELADSLEYKRYWFTEHHNATTILSMAPDLLMMLAGTLTKNMNIGAGGIMLPNYSPYKVAENFAILEAAFPNRVDLGMGRASGTDLLAKIALQMTREKMIEVNTADQIQEIIYHLTKSFPVGHPLQALKIPGAPYKPNMFMLGSSDGGLSLAAKFGLKFAFAGQLNPRQDVQLLNLYKHRFEEQGHEEKPYSILSKFIFVADTEEEAKLAALPAEISWMKMYMGAKTEELQLLSVEEAANYEFTPHELAIREQNKGRFIIGNPVQVKTQIQELERTALIDEIMVADYYADQRTRLKGYTLFAELMKA